MKKIMEDLQVGVGVDAVGDTRRTSKGLAKNIPFDRVKQSRPIKTSTTTLDRTWVGGAPESNKLLLPRKIPPKP